MKLSDLFEEDDQNPIPDHFLDILKDLGEDWRDEMINRKLDFSSFNIDKAGMSGASENINNYLKNGIRTEKGEQYKDFLQFPPAKDILIDILKATEDTTTGEGFRQQLFKLAKDFLQFEDEFTVVPGSASFNYNPATKLMIRLINQQIEESETVEGLSQQLGKTEERTILLLDKYLRLLQGNSDYKQFLEEGNIIPNRYHQFCSYDFVHAFGTEENPLDDSLLDILKTLDSQEDWREFLVADGIGITLGQTKKLDELCNSIWEEITRIKGEDSYQQNREILLDFIDWGESHEEEVNRYFTGFKAFADRAFFILTIERSTHGKQVMRLFKDEEQVKALSTISEAGINITDLLKLAEISHELGSTESIITYAQGLIEEKRDFEFLKELGETVEDVVQKALRNSELGNQSDFEIVRQGFGSCDLIIKNTSNQKEFYIEVKSYAFGKRDDIKMALSQVKLCIGSPDQFALCVIERPEHRTMPDISYIRNKMKWVSNVSGVVKKPFDLYSDFYEGKSHLGDATLEVQLIGEVKVALRLQYIEQNFSSFNELIEEITRRLQ